MAALPECPPEGPLRLVCRCIGVSSARIAAAVRAGSTDSDAVGRATSAGGGCTTCHPEILEILGACLGEPVPALTSETNRRTCAEQTRLRISDAVDLGPARMLPPGMSLELVCAEGLRVELLLTPRGSRALEGALTEKLRKLVCSELEVVFA